MKSPTLTKWHEYLTETGQARAKEMYRLHQKGMTIHDIATKYNLSPQRVSALFKRYDLPTIYKRDR